MSGEKRVRLKQLDDLRAQIDQLERLLGEAGYDKKTWKSRVVTSWQEGRLTLGLRLEPKSNAVVVVHSVVNAHEDDGLGRERRYFIDGSFHYDEFADRSLRDDLRRAPATRASEVQAKIDDLLGQMRTAGLRPGRTSNFREEGFLEATMKGLEELRQLAGAEEEDG